MRVIRVDRFDDPRLADYRNVSDGQLLRRRNRFVAEGRVVVGRLLDAGGRVESLLVNDASYRALQSEMSRLPPDIPVYVSDTEQFTMITGFNLHRGCLALAERPVERTFDEVVQ
jgi:tRNA G18 (ribose-2'-O)-methylase SpoU